MSLSAEEAVDEDGGVRSENPFLYLLVFGSEYMLYKIDIISYYASSNDDMDRKILPILVFPRDVLRYNCAFEKLGSNLYFVKRNCVYTIKTSDIDDLTPAEDNDGVKYLTEIPAMHGLKNDPITFVASDKLYVLSSISSMYSPHKKLYVDFEVYNPLDNLWNVLPPYPTESEYDSIVSYLVVDDTLFYFATKEGCVLTFDPSTQTWNLLYDYIIDYNSYHPTYDKFGVINVGDKLFAGFNHFSYNHYFNIFASLLDPSLNATVMHPSLAPDYEFRKNLSSKVFEYISAHEDYGSHRMISIDNKNVLCLVSYGNPFNCIHPFKNYILLTFIEVPNGYDKIVESLEDTAVELLEDDYIYCAKRKEGDSLATHYFKANIMHRVLFCIETSRLEANGEIVGSHFESK